MRSQRKRVTLQYTQKKLNAENLLLFSLVVLVFMALGMNLA